MHTNIMFLLTMSQGQEVAQSAGQMPQTRGDLEALSRLAIEQIGASFGVPADLMFQGRFASKSTAQYATPWSLTHALIPFFLAHGYGTTNLGIVLVVLTPLGFQRPLF